MSRTRHLHKRMSQRGITSRLVDVVSRFGVPINADRIILDRKNTLHLLHHLDRLRADLLEIGKKGGLVVVESNARQLTVFRPEFRRPSERPSEVSTNA